MNISLTLRRPLAIIDLETTGLNPDRDRIVELAILKIQPDGLETQYLKRLNPQIPIPAGASAVHGIRDCDVAGAPPFAEVAAEILDFLQDCDLAGFNISNYDLRLLRREFERAGISFSINERAIVDAQQIYHAKERRDLKAACRFYLQEEHDKAHSALDDALATWRVLNAQLLKYSDLPRDPAALDRIFTVRRYVDAEGKFEWRDQEAVFSFGRYRGRLLRNIAKEDPDYLGWIADKADFPEESRQIASNALRGVFPGAQRAALSTENSAG